MKSARSLRKGAKEAQESTTPWSQPPPGVGSKREPKRVGQRSNHDRPVSHAGSIGSISEPSLQRLGSHPEGSGKRHRPRSERTSRRTSRVPEAEVTSSSAAQGGTEDSRSTCNPETQIIHRRSTLFRPLSFDGLSQSPRHHRDLRLMLVVVVVPLEPEPGGPSVFALTGASGSTWFSMAASSFADTCTCSAQRDS